MADIRVWDCICTDEQRSAVREADYDALAADLTAAQEELRLCQQDAITLQARLAEAEALLREWTEDHAPEDAAIAECPACEWDRRRLAWLASSANEGPA